MKWPAFNARPWGVAIITPHKDVLQERYMPKEPSMDWMVYGDDPPETRFQVHLQASEVFTHIAYSDFCCPITSRVVFPGELLGYLFKPIRSYTQLKQGAGNKRL